MSVEGNQVARSAPLQTVKASQSGQIVPIVQTAKGIQSVTTTPPVTCYLSGVELSPVVTDTTGLLSATALNPYFAVDVVALIEYSTKLTNEGSTDTKLLAQISSALLFKSGLLADRTKPFKFGTRLFTLALQPLTELALTLQSLPTGELANLPKLASSRVVPETGSPDCKILDNFLATVTSHISSYKESYLAELKDRHSKSAVDRKLANELSNLSHQTLDLHIAKLGIQASKNTVLLTDVHNSDNMQIPTTIAKSILNILTNANESTTRLPLTEWYKLLCTGTSTLRKEYKDTDTVELTNDLSELIEEILSLDYHFANKGLVVKILSKKVAAVAKSASELALFRQGLSLEDLDFTLNIPNIEAIASTSTSTDTVVPTTSTAPTQADLKLQAQEALKRALLARSSKS